MYIASNGIKTAVIERDPDPQNPRDPLYQDNITTMTCWHRRYNLGDEHRFESPRDFLTDLAERHVTYPEFFRFVQDGGAWQLRLEEVHHVEGVGNGDPKYVLERIDGDLGEGYWESTGCLVSEDLRRISGPELREDGLLEYLDRRELEKLLASSENVLVKPLYLYDHSGISISTGSFIGRAPHAEWDSGQVGCVHMDKKTAIYELFELSGGRPKALTDATWKARAEEYIEIDVAEYDNYLTGEVYGYRTFEGLDEVDSCWGFNPGDASIEQLMKEELGSWYGPGLEFELNYDRDFDIEDFFERHDFPELRGRIEADVLACLSEIEKGPGPYPFELSPEEIRGDGGVLGDIVSEIYEEHLEPTPERIREALDDHAGIAREMKPKLTVSDLDPDRDYTIEELVDLAKQKAAKRAALSGAEQAFGKLAEMIAQKAIKGDGPEL